MTRRDRWAHEPTASGRQPDRVSSRQMRPLGALDRTRDGDKLGPCPRCGGLRWWDNTGRKGAGQMSPRAPDYACVECRHGRWLEAKA